MKHTVQVRSHGGKDRPPIQAQTPKLSKDQSTAADTKYYVLSLIEFTHGATDTRTVMGEIDVPSGDFEILEGEARKRGGPGFNKLLKIGYEAMVNAFPNCELENATAASNSLLQLLCEHIEYQRQNPDASHFSGGGCSGTLCFGLHELVESCRDRLTKAMEVTS